MLPYFKKSEGLAPSDDIAIEGETEKRPNLTIITGAHVTRVILEGAAGHKLASGVECGLGSDETRSVHATKEVVLSGGAIGSPHLLLLSGIGPRAELEAAGIACQVDSPHVGKYLKDHLQVGLFFHAPGAAYR